MTSLRVVRLAPDKRGRVGRARACASALALFALLCQITAPGRRAAAAAATAQSLPTISISDASNIEGDGTESSQIFTVTLSAASAQTVTVSYATADGTAAAGSDYNAQTGNVTFDPGQTRKFIVVIAISDRVIESDETFFVNLSAPVNATLARAQGVGTIRNDDAPGSLEFSSERSIAEEGLVEHIGVIRRNGKLGAVTVDYAVTGGTATTGLDYDLGPGKLTFADGETFKQIQLRVLDDTLVEPTETILLALSNPTGGATLGPQATHTVLVADSPPKAFVNDVTVVEGDSGTTAAVFTVSLSSPSAETETVQYKAPGGTVGGGQYSRVAQAGSDYAATSGTLTFAPGETQKTFTVPVTGDTERELTEVFSVEVSSSTIQIRDLYGFGTIMNDDGPPLIGTAHAVESENCAPANNAPDAGETVTVSFCLRNVGPADTTNLVATLRPTGGVTSPGDAQTYGAVAVGASHVCRSFTFKVDPSLAPGQAVAATLDLQDGASTLTPVTFQIAVSRREPLRENFDGGSSQLTPPQGWEAPSVGESHGSQWFRSSEAFDSFPHSFTASTDSRSSLALISPTFTVNTAQAVLTFRHSFDLAETDGTVLDISLDGGQTYADIVAAGGTFVSGGYTGTNSSPNRPAWNGNSGGFITTAIILPAAAAGRSVRLRWTRFNRDSSGRAGHFIDNVLVTDSLQPCGLPPAPPAPVLLTQEGTERALSLDSVTLMRGPFPARTWHNFSADGRTRVALYARNVELLAGEDAGALTAQAEDALGAIHQLAIEHVGPLPGVEGATQINVVLPDALSAGGEFRVSVKLRGKPSNKVLLSVKPSAAP